MKISALRKVILLCLICSFTQSKAQFNYKFSDGGIPVVGIQYGVVAGGHSATLYNSDDVSSELIAPATNFTYFAGAERLQWYNPHFGVGQQLLLWNAGAKYTGKLNPADNAPNINATTTLSYVKLPVLFWWKSYNRWHPDRRFRANTFFGPYVAMLLGGQEEWNITVPGTDVNNTYLLKSGSYTAKDKDGNQFFDGLADDGQPFKIFDWGFTMGGGIEMRMWTNTVVSLTVRADIGMPEVENKKFEVNNEAGKRYRFYADITEKFIPYTTAQGEFFDNNRGETTNFSYGAQVSIKKYIGGN